MKFKHFLAAFAAIIGIASIAVAATLIVNKLLGGNAKSLGYIECSCKDDEETAEEPAEQIEE
jgi:hypothetical protein